MNPDPIFDVFIPFLFIVFSIKYSNISEMIVAWTVSTFGLGEFVAKFMSDIPSQQEVWMYLVGVVFTFIYWFITRSIYTSFPKFSILFHLFVALATSYFIFFKKGVFKILSVSKFPMFNTIFSYALFVFVFCLIIFIRYKKFSELGDE